MNKLQADLSLLVVTICAAAGWLFSKTALTELPPFLFIGSRFILAAIVLQVFCHKALISLSMKDKASGIVTGSLFALAMMTWVVGLDRSQHVGEAAFIVSLGVMFVPFFSALLLNESLPRSLMVSLPIAIIGLAALNLEVHLAQGWQWDQAQLILLAAAVIFAFQFAFTGYLAKRIAPLTLTTMQLWVSGCIATTTGLLLEPLPEQLSLLVISNLIAAAVIASSLRFFLQTRALKYSPASHAGMILLLEPVWVCLMSWVFFAQTLTPYQFTGCALIFTALLISRLMALKA